MATVACRKRVSRANAAGVTARGVTVAPLSRLEQSPLELAVSELHPPASGASRHTLAALAGQFEGGGAR